MKLLFLLPGIRKELSVAVPAGYGNENGKLRKQAMQEESRKEKNFIKRIDHAERQRKEHMLCEKIITRQCTRYDRTKTANAYENI